MRSFLETRMYSNQQVIDAFYNAARAEGLPATAYWGWIIDAGLTYIAERRHEPYTGPQIGLLPGLTLFQSSAIQRELEAMQPLDEGRTLNVPWVSQLDPQSTAPNDCGQACVLMLLRFYGKVGITPTVDQLSARMPGKTVAEQLRTLASLYGLDLTIDANNHEIDNLVDCIDQGHPVILLVDYKLLGFPDHLQSGVDQGWHWLLVIGYDDSNFVVHDPLWTPAQREGRGGAFLKIQGNVLLNAMVGRSRLYSSRVNLDPVGGHTVGFHVVLGARYGYRDALMRLSEAGIPAKLVYAVDEGGALQEAKAIDPETTTIFRTFEYKDTPPDNWTGDPVQYADTWMEQVMGVWAQNPADYYIPINEPKCDSPEKWQWLNKFMERCIDIANERDFRLALYSFAAGGPELEDWRYLLPSLKKGYNSGHILSLHEYGIPASMRAAFPYLTTRYRQVYAEVLGPAGMGDMPLVITEAAPNGGHNWGGLTYWMEEVKWYTLETARDPYVMGVAWFTLGDWANANYQDALPHLAEWLVQNF